MSQTNSQYYTAQRSVIGSLLLDAPHVAGMVMHRTRPEDYTGSAAPSSRPPGAVPGGQAIDATIVRGRIGAAYTDFLVQLMEETPTAANVSVYIDLMVEQAKLAKLQGMALELAGAVTLEDAQKLVARANRILGRPPRGEDRHHGAGPAGLLRAPADAS